MKLFVTALVLVLNLSVFSQEFTISGKVVDKDGKPLSYVNVIIENANDNSFINGTSTNDNGQFKINNLFKENYILKVSFIGFKSEVFTIELIKNITLKNITLIEDSEALDQVTITAKRPTITRKPDRLTFNVENTALTEGSTLQVLKNTPGVIVTDGSINIKSSAATIFINNRRVQLSSSELIQLLESAPANSIKSIDVITNPPASYDADSGSVINIIMSKNLVTGYRGSVAANYTQGVFPRYNGATSHYFKNNKINLNVNYSYTNQKINRDVNSGIDFFNDSGNIDQIWNSNSNRNTRSEFHNVNFNFDYFLSEKTTLSLTSTALFIPFFNNQISNNTIINDASSSFLDRFSSDNISRDNKHNIGSDLNLRTEFDNGGSLSINGHYTIYSFNRNQNLIQLFQEDNSLDSEFNTDANQDTEIYSAKADYNVSAGESSSFDAGAKISNITTESDITRLDIINGSEVFNTANSNVFDYDETILAAYANYSKSWDNWDLIFGLRAEQTNIEGFSPTLNQTNTQDYFEWFPNASISHTITDNFIFYGNYKRSITRPSYTTLNPFTFFVNENTISVGNPDLQPTFQDHFVIGTNFWENFTIEAYYINYDGAINEIPRQDNTNNILAYTPVNLDKTVDFGFDFAMDLYPTENWNLYFATSFYNISEENNFGGDIIKLDQWSNYSILANNISFLEDNSLDVNLTLTFVGKNQIALTVVEDQLYSELSITKTIFNKKGIVSLSVNDIFNLQDEDNFVRYLNQSTRRFTDLDNRFIKLGFRYKFGNTKLNTNERSTKAEERDRLKERDN